MTTPSPMKRSHTTAGIHQFTASAGGIPWPLLSLRKAGLKTRRKVAPLDTAASDHPECLSPIGVPTKLTTTQSAYDVAIIREQDQKQEHQGSQPSKPPAPSKTFTTINLNELVRSLTDSAKRNLSEISLLPNQRSHRNCAFQLRKKDIRIFLKTPYVSAGGLLSGALAISLRNSNAIASGDVTEISNRGLTTALLAGFQSIALELTGIESIYDTLHGSHTHVFLSHSLIFLNKTAKFLDFISSGEKALVIPFGVQLSRDLDGTYEDRKGSIVYVLKGHLHVTCSCRYCSKQPHKHQDAKIIPIDRQVLVKSNAHSKLTTDAHLYLPLHESRTVWPHFTFPLGVQLQVSLTRTIWMSGMPVYVAVRITNHSAHSVSDIVVELLRRQHTFLRRSDEQEGTSLIPLTSSCTVSAHTSAEKSLEWYLPVQPGKSEEATLVLQAPKDQWSIRNRMFMDISFSIRVSLVSRTARGEEQSLEIPIFLTHPVSVDPLPSLRVPPPENSASDPGRRQREGDLFYALDRSRKSYSLSSWESALDEDSELEYPSDDEDLDLHNDLQVCHRALSKN